MRILVAVDYSSRTLRTLEELAARPWPPNTTFRVLSVVEKVPPSAVELWFDAEGSLAAVLKAREARSRELAEKAAGLLRGKGIIVEVTTRYGGRRKAIAQERRSWSADVVLDAALAMPPDLSRLLREARVR